MALSDAAIHTAKPRKKQFRLYDEGGLILIVRPSGGKLWRFEIPPSGQRTGAFTGPLPSRGFEGGAGRPGSGSQAD